MNMKYKEVELISNLFLPFFSILVLFPSQIWTTESESEKGLNCSFDGQSYVSGAAWIHHEDCAHCSCQNGLAFCKPIQCDYPKDCKRVVKPPSLSQLTNGSCCPVCADCVSKSGRSYAEGEVWDDDSCTTCVCSEGRKRCHTISCKTTCLHPRFVPGQCCPVCDGNNRCPSLASCSRTCPLGFATDDEGCAVCRCIEGGPPPTERRCSITGDWLDECGRACVCRHGLEFCSVLSCPAASCVQPLFYPGDCCPRCEDSARENFNASASANVLSCSSSSVDSNSASEYWSVGPCLNCTCHNGQILCASSSSAAAVQCPCHKQTVVVAKVAVDGESESECCATCPENKQQQRNESFSSSTQNVNCFSELSRSIYGDGESWKVGDCQTCVCVGGLIDCFPTQKCETCASSVYVKSHCCPTCLDFSHNSNSLSKSRLFSEPHCIILTVTIAVLATATTIYVIGYRLRKRHRKRQVLKATASLIARPPSTPSPPMTPNYNCCYKYGNGRRAQLSEQKTPLCLSTPAELNSTNSANKSENANVITATSSFADKM